MADPKDRFLELLRSTTLNGIDFVELDPGTASARCNWPELGEDGSGRLVGRREGLQCQLGSGEIDRGPHR